MKSKFDLNLTPVQHEEIIKRGTMEIDGIQYNTNFSQPDTPNRTGIHPGQAGERSPPQLPADPCQIGGEGRPLYPGPGTWNKHSISYK